MTIEQRLRSELERVAPKGVSGAPDVDLMQETVDRRRRRNSMATRLAVVVVGVVAAGSALIAVRPAADVVSTTSPTADEVVDEVVDEQPSVAETPSAAPADAASDEDSAVAEQVEGDASVVTAPDIADAQPQALQADPESLTVAQQVSAVQFSGGSGVFVVPFDSGYAALASRFGGPDGVEMMGMRSADGLEWAEADVSGLPAGSTATALHEHDGQYVALLSGFDVELQQRLNHVAVSSDMTSWQSMALPGGGLVAMDLAVGSAGVIVVGEAPNPLVWVGEVGGPYRRVGRVRGANSLAGVVAVEGGFVAAGTSSTGPQLFQSTDGTNWLGAPVTGVDGEDTLVAMTVMDGRILLAGSSDQTTWTVTSGDGGQTWQRGEFDLGQVGSVAAASNTITLLSSSSLGTTNVALSNGSSWSSADLEFEGDTRINLLLADTDLALLLADVDGELTWVVASR